MRTRNKAGFTWFDCLKSAIFIDKSCSCNKLMVVYAINGMKGK